MANLILEAIQTAIKDGEATVNLKEATSLTGSGSGIGGRTIYDDAFASLRMMNPIRLCARQFTTIGSDESFVAKTGNITNIQSGSNNPWGYSPINNNNATTGLNTALWNLPLRAIQASVPIRTAVLSDINNIEQSIVTDIAKEFAQQEALSMMFNNDQSGSTTVTYGATVGLRGLNSYPNSFSTASFGTSGTAITDGLHTVLGVQAEGPSAITYNDISNLAGALPPQYWANPCCAWMMHPTTIRNLRKLTGGTTGIPVLQESGDMDGGAVTTIYGFPVIPNPYMSTAGANNYPIYLGAWDEFVSIADNELMKIQMFEQTNVGFITLFAERRVCSTIRDVFAGVRLKNTAS